MGALFPALFPVVRRGVGVMFACQPRGEGGGRVCFWAEAGLCMLTRSLLLEHSSSGVGRADCMMLNDNAITELAASLFYKLTNLGRLYVTLDAVMHAPFRS